jgi:hypothetical protein
MIFITHQGRIFVFAGPKSAPEAAFRPLGEAARDDGIDEVAARALFQISPVQSHAQFYQQWHCQRMRILHVLAHQLLHAFDFVLRHFENQFVVHL